MKTITPDQVRPTPERAGSFVGLQNLFEKYHLESENGGYIFRSFANRSWGHSGHHPTRTAACWRAVNEANTTIFEFETKEALNTWLNTSIP